MSVLRRNRTVPVEPAAATPPQADVAPPASTPNGKVAPTRTSAAWLGICLTAIGLVVLIVFLLQNTRSVEVSFLWLHGTLPLAIALLIAAVGAALLTMTVGVARITQLRRRFRRTRSLAAPEAGQPAAAPEAGQPTA
jgi:uncharacterized integral membrane protein